MQARKIADLEVLRQENIKLKLEKAKHETNIAQLRSAVASLQQELKASNEENTRLGLSWAARLKTQEDSSNLLIQRLSEQINAKATSFEPSPSNAAHQKMEEKVEQGGFLLRKGITSKSKDTLLQKFGRKKSDSPLQYITPTRIETISQPTYCSKNTALSSFNHSEQERIHPIDKVNGAIDSSAFRSLALLGNYSILRDTAFRQQDTSPLSAD